MELDTIYNLDCEYGINLLDDESIDLVCTSPPYNVGVKYDEWMDKMQSESYFNFINNVFSNLYPKMKKDGRLAINIPIEVNMKDRGGRINMAAKYNHIIESIGYKFAGSVDLHETTPHRTKYCAFGSWLSPSAPYIYNPKEVIQIYYKDSWKKLNKGKSYFTDDPESKKEFIKLVSGVWDYRAETHGLTKANFSIDLPMNAIKILTYENDVVLDMFSGSGQTLLAAKNLNRRYIGFEISKNYYTIAKSRLG